MLSAAAQQLEILLGEKCCNADDERAKAGDNCNQIRLAVLSKA
jgi:hypothetical protein